MNILKEKIGSHYKFQVALRLEMLLLHSLVLELWVRAIVTLIEINEPNLVLL